MWQYLVRLQTLTVGLGFKLSEPKREVPDDAGCVSANLRTVLMSAVSTWKRMLGVAII